MENELLNIFDDRGKQIGTATREDVHKLGHWHEVFHCWIISKEENKHYIYFQLRSSNKKDFPNLMDITSAGHLLASETVVDGVREVKEEIGIDVSYEELISLDQFKYSFTTSSFIDNEYAHVFLYSGENVFDKSILQLEEVSGLMRTDFESFCKMWQGEAEHINIEGYIMSDENERVYVKQLASRNNFVPHPVSYYEYIVNNIAKHI